MALSTHSQSNLETHNSLTIGCIAMVHPFFIAALKQFPLFKKFLSLSPHVCESPVYKWFARVPGMREVVRTFHIAFTKSVKRS